MTHYFSNMQGLREVVLKDGKRIARCYDAMNKKWNEFEITADQYRRICEWQDSNGLIQTHLADLSADQREMLISGVNAEDWDKMFGEDEDDEDYDPADEAF